VTGIGLVWRLGGRQFGFRFRASGHNQLPAVHVRLGPFMSRTAGMFAVPVGASNILLIYGSQDSGGVCVVVALENAEVETPEGLGKRVSRRDNFPQINAPGKIRVRVRIISSLQG
jgi:hypothetical protein